MLDSLEKMTNPQQAMFRDVANKLLAYNFLARDKKDNKEAYYFLMSYKDIFDEFFKILGLEITLNQQQGLLYHEKMKETSLNDNVICQVADIHEKYDYLEIKKKLNKTDLVAALRLFRRYNLIEATGDLSTSTCKIVLMPTILLAIPSDDINSLYQTINRIKQGGDEE